MILHCFPSQEEYEGFEKSAKRKYKELEDVIFVDLKIIALYKQIISFAPYEGRDGTIEPIAYGRCALHIRGYYVMQYYNKLWDKAPRLDLEHAGISRVQYIVFCIYVKLYEYNIHIEICPDTIPKNSQKLSGINMYLLIQVLQIGS
ncbi:hypothetical protein C1645_740008 [Glomus cerebriforme]|uniref:Uncharacterized protein n=1 Tax=Glomus cerebriforme TaxID=658196 RepID=A0A397SNA2_9GLOM|nr:hypothetical protein C1645_740008 [Glomus cerebriforme]